MINIISLSPAVRCVARVVVYVDFGFSPHGLLLGRKYTSFETHRPKAKPVKKPQRSVSPPSGGGGKKGMSGAEQRALTELVGTIKTHTEQLKKSRVDITSLVGNK